MNTLYIKAESWRKKDVLISKSCSSTSKVSSLPYCTQSSRSPRHKYNVHLMFPIEVTESCSPYSSCRISKRIDASKSTSSHDDPLLALRLRNYISIKISEMFSNRTTKCI